MKRNTSGVSWFLPVALLGGCIDNQPEPPAPPPPMATVSGVVEIDTAIQNATVYLDLDDNNQLDDFEPHAATDATGHYTLTWDNSGPLQPHAIGAVVDPTATRVGVTGPSSAVQVWLHMRAPLGDTSGAVVISPLSTLVVSEMESDATLTLATAKAKVTAALTASHLSFSGQPLDVMADYASDTKAGTATSADSLQLRDVAGAVAVLVSTSVEKINSAQSIIDCNDATYFDPAIVAMDKQLTTIANGTLAFSQLSTAQQSDVMQNPANYPDYFIDTTALADDIENALLEAAEDLAAALFDEFQKEFVSQLEELTVDLGSEIIVELALKALGL